MMVKNNNKSSHELLSDRELDAVKLMGPAKVFQKSLTNYL